jgi:DNA-directed RNA polymerase subunit RPC12/RpoP
MYYPRHYRCLACGEKFTRSDGVICLPSAGVTCPHCGSKKTIERPLGGLLDLFGSLVRVLR